MPARLPAALNAARDVLHAGVLSYGKPAETWDWRTGWCKESEKDNPSYGCPRGKNNVFPFPLEAFVDTVHAIGAGAAAISPNMGHTENLADQLEFIVYTDALLRNTSKFPGATIVPKLLVELGGEAFWGKHTCMPGSTHSPCRWHNATVFGQEVDAWATAIRAALPEAILIASGAVWPGVMHNTRPNSLGGWNIQVAEALRDDTAIDGFLLHPYLVSGPAGDCNSDDMTSAIKCPTSDQATCLIRGFDPVIAAPLVTLSRLQGT